jgi:hypothetical protein
MQDINRLNLFYCEQLQLFGLKTLQNAGNDCGQAVDAPHKAVVEGNPQSST